MSFGLVGYASSSDEGESDEIDTDQKISNSIPPKKFENDKQPSFDKAETVQGQSDISSSLLNNKKPDSNSNIDILIEDDEDDFRSSGLKETQFEFPESDNLGINIIEKHSLNADSNPPAVAGYDDDIVEDVYKKKNYSTEKLPVPISKTKKKIKIAALSNLDLDSDEDEPKKKKPKPSSSKSGLSALLPSPKNTFVKEKNRPLIPHTLTKGKSPNVPLKPKTSNVNVTNKPVVSSAKNISSSISDDEDDDITSSDFFSFSDSKNKDINSTSSISSSADSHNLLYDLSSSADTFVGAKSKSVVTSEDSFVGPAKPSGLASLNLPEPVSSSGASSDTQYETEPNEGESFLNDEEFLRTEPNEGESFLNDEEFLRMLPQGKKKRGNESINLIDVNVDDQIDKLELQRSLTEEAPRRSFSKKKNADMPTSMQRRKHQIQYLAFQAKESEVELKNQWSNSRMNRKQTQAKYGF